MPIQYVATIPGSDAERTVTNITGISHGRLLEFSERDVLAAYTADPNDVLLLCDGTGGAFTVTLPPAAELPRKLYLFKKIDGANNVTIDGNASETIDGATTYVMSTQWESVWLYSDGANWITL